MINTHSTEKWTDFYGAMIPKNKLSSGANVAAVTTYPWLQSTSEEVQVRWSFWQSMD